MKKFIRYLLILSLLVATADICTATPNRPQISATFELLSKPAKGGLVQIKLKIEPLRDISEVEFRIRKTYHIDDFTLPVKTLKVKKGEVSEIILDVNIPANDTSGIFLYVESIPRYIFATPAIYFVTTGDTLETFPGRPESYPAKKSPPQDHKLNRDTLTTEHLNTIYHIGFDIRSPEQLEFVKQYVDSLIPEGKYYRAYITLETALKIEDNNQYKDLDMDVLNEKQFEEYKRIDSIKNVIENNKKNYVPKITVGQMTESERLLERKQQAEKYILTDKPNESFYIDNVMWQRNRGEQYFRVIEPITDTKAYTKNITDSLEALPDDHLFNLCLIISEDNKADALAILGSLPEPIEGIFYHLKVKKGDIPKLDKAGIRLSYKFNSTCDHKISSSSIDSKKN